MTIIVKSDGKIYVWRKSERKLHSIYLGYLSDGPGMALILMVCGTMNM